jgi:type IV secretion system protein VirD4
MFGSGKKNNAKPSDPGSSIYLGRYFDVRTGKSGSELTYDGERHLLLFGPTGSGKGTRLLVNNLLRIRDRSIVVIDPKGELTAITADYRRKLGKVVVLNPFDVLELGGAGFNPLAALDPDDATFVDDASGIGEALVMIDPNEKDPHWSDSARSLLTALIMWEVKLAREQKREPSMENVRYLLTQPNEYERDAEGNRKLVAGMRITAGRMAAKGGFEIESLISRFLRETDEIASIQSTADRHTAWMLSPLMRANMAKNDIDFAALKERPTTVYLILPAERMRTHAVWLRLVIVSALRAMYLPGGLKTLFMLDEFAQLGHLGPIEEALALVRGFGIQLWPVLQDLTQLKALYKDRWETFVANAGVVQAFAPNDLTTAEWMSQRAGDTTVAAAGYNRGDQQSDAGRGSINTGLSYSQARRRLLLPQELMDFRAGSGLLWPAGTSKSVPFAAPPYWETECKSRARSNPYYEKRGLPVRKRKKVPARTAPAAPARDLGADALRAGRAIQKFVVKATPPTLRALRIAANEALRFARWSGKMIAEHGPPLMRKLKAYSIETYQFARKISADGMEWYRRRRENRQKIVDKKEPGPPVTASRDIRDGAD